MKKLIIALCTLFLVTACNFESEVKSIQAASASEKMWAYIEFSVPQTKGKNQPYFYYAEISKQAFQKISNNDTPTGFILLEKVKYWNNDDLIEAYKDKENTGDLAFRIEHIIRINPINFEPVVGQGYEQFEETAQEVKEPENLEAQTTKTNE
ncbi:membrane lipoprotein lipid attachment site-containing protein [Parashewanella tropica]|uniref:membrane lipoprotein lipid attachment site-containing protein n=1 Tax=Parashewanella tropica TaxID=2547970 RepID=UPI001059C064|nr:membrane lipoprotein lipid attachment site-containing protein [Parashewanella tropica]